MKEKIKIKIYCYACKNSEETCRVICSRCGNSNIGIEPDLEWHRLSRLFALFHGFEDRVDPFSLVQWFQEHPIHLEEYRKFRHRLLTPELIPLPYPPRDRERFEDQTLFSSSTEAYRWYWVYSGIISLHSGFGGGEPSVRGIGWGVAEPVVKGFRSKYPFLEKAAIAFVQYCSEKGFVR